MTRSQVNFRAEDSHINRWKQSAKKQGISLTEWIKNVADDAAGAPATKEISFEAAAHAGNDDGTGTPVPQDEPDSGERQKTQPTVRGHARDKSPRKKTCDHGKPRGHHCGLCGGKAKVR